MKENFGCHRFEDDVELAAVVRQQLTTQNTDRYHHGIPQYLPWCDKCLSCGGDHEKRSKTHTEPET